MMQPGSHHDGNPTAEASSTNALFTQEGSQMAKNDRKGKKLTANKTAIGRPFPKQYVKILRRLTTQGELVSTRDDEYENELLVENALVNTPGLIK
jgi:hypothetical protein